MSHHLRPTPFETAGTERWPCRMLQWLCGEFEAPPYPKANGTSTHTKAQRLPVDRRQAKPAHNKKH